MNRLANFLYHKVHTTGWLANAVYSAAYPLNGLRRRLRDRKARQDAVSPEAAHHLQHLGASSSIVIGLTNICNARCVFRAYPKAVDSKSLKTGVMALGLFKSVVDEWSALGGTEVDLTHTVGDPLIDPGLLDKIHYAVQQAHIQRISFTTNGILLNRNDTYKRLVDSGVTAIAISTASTDQDIYEKTYGVKHYEDMLSGVHNLLDYNRSKGEPISITIRFRNAQQPSEIINSADFIREFKPYFSPKVRCNFTAEFDNWGGAIKSEDVFGQMKLRQENRRLDVPCKALFNFLVRYDGSVRLCGCRFKRSDLDDMIVGNVREQSLLEISKSPKAWEIIKGFYSGRRPDTCLGCTLYDPINAQWLQTREQTLAQRPELPARPGAPAASKPLPSGVDAESLPSR